ncbi:hypothetical protein [Halobaculum magnesiiphilum]|uniref:Uncharacterized protein n=1 Tax=Halobaculum magnesiiphilum TaxID=1017351 RepID=A0A8T8WFK0_9EURY|nr:hypothetical protein [Halobaculum magnesiiphilum]QZP38637.1 hypothetical protein K6T50_05715 [Halobaculum magnesiiphilum]
MPGTDPSVRDLWIERAARRLGFTRLARAVGWETGAPYLLVAAVVGIHIPLLSVVGWTRTGTLSMAVNPGEVFQIPAWLGVVWVMRRLKGRYARATADLPDAVDPDLTDFDPEGSVSRRLTTALGIPDSGDSKETVEIESIVPARVILGIVLVGWALYATQLLTNPESLIGPVVELTGPAVAAVRFYVIIPLALYPIGGELLGLIVGALVILPLKIRRGGLIDFSDPHGAGGLEAVGRLFKSIAVTYFVLLALFTTFQTVAIGADPTSLFSSTFILAGLAFGVALFFGPMLWLRGYIGAAKEHKIDVLAQRTADIGDTADRFPYAEPASPEETSRYLYERLRMDQIERTSELPLNTGMLQEVLFALVLPYVTSMAFDYLIGTVA